MAYKATNGSIRVDSIESTNIWCHFNGKTNLVPDSGPTMQERLWVTSHFASSDLWDTQVGFSICKVHIAVLETFCEVPAQQRQIL